MKTNKLERYAPPGADLKGMMTLFAVFLGLELGRCLLSFPANFHAWLETLEKAVPEYVQENPWIVKSFGELVGGSLLGFWPLVLAAAGCACANRMIFSGATKSIYLMKRVPDRWELVRRCTGIPLMAVGAGLCLAAVMLAFFWLLYTKIPPAQCVRSVGIEDFLRAFIW